MPFCALLRYQWRGLDGVAVAISISDLQVPFCFLSICVGQTFFLVRRPRKYRYSRWNFTNMLSLAEGFTISGLRRHLGFSYVGRWQHTRATTMNKTRIWYQNLGVLDGCHTFLRHIFRPYISVHFRNLFVSHIALPVKRDINKPCQQHIQVRCPWKYESNHWKCLLLLIGRFIIGHTTFRWFPKMYFRFPRHRVNISGRDVTELYMAINSPRSPWQCLKSAWPYLLQFWGYRGKSGLGAFYPICRDRGYNSNA